MKSETVRHEIKALIASRGYTLTYIVSKMNEQRSLKEKTTVQNISNKLSRGTIKYSEVLEIVDIIGLEIKWVPMLGEKREISWTVI